MLKEHPKVLIACDDIYEFIYWGKGPYRTLLNVCPELAGRTVVVNGVSKGYAMTGWRIGYLAGPEELVAAMRKVQGQSTSCPSSVSQAAATAALTGPQDCVGEMRKAFRQRYRFMRSALNEIPGVDCPTCDGTGDPGDPVCPGCRAKVEGGETLETRGIQGNQRFVRIQGSPDLTAEDLLGDIDPSMAFQFGCHDWRAFTPGKLLKGNRGIVFFDELNRIPEKLQNALLQVLEEHTATIGPYDVDYAANFLMLATMNPLEHAGVEELSDVLLDRFDVVTMGYPETALLEKQILLKYGRKLDGIDFPDDALDKLLVAVRSTREDPWGKEMDQGASVRAALALYEKAQAQAWLQGDSSVTLDHLRSVAVSTMAGRIKTSPESKYYDDPVGLVKELLQEVLGGSKG